MSSDGSTGGIGGVLCDKNRQRLLYFSSSISSECDNKSVVDWICDVSKAPSYFAEIINNVAKRLIEGWLRIRYIPRCCNMEADQLAKCGIG
ncbi:hypothetical protein V6N13_042478 [Hibiscus sabdariffa]|uniref:RNase H type-1 domain-containing protein n=1 Tax=Hibiscus sabdariffa TaxID=183260 RepID=A0ABR2G5N7_9ROSI